MAVIDYRKFKVLIDADSPKVQGLRTGDIVRRLYFDGNRVVYTLMCVLGNGVESVADESGERIISRPYFIGALLEGDAPESGQILDFIRMTNIVDTERGGSVCLNSLGQHPSHIDAIDDIGRSCSLCWPDALAEDFVRPDPARQYVVSGQAEYLPELDGNRRVCHITGTRTSDQQGSAVGIIQEFHRNVSEGDRILVSYKVRAGRDMEVLATFSTSGEAGEPPTERLAVTDGWTYSLHVFSIESQGYMPRTIGLSVEGFTGSDEVWIADLNVILLSSLSSFSDSSLARLGRLDGIADPVFGRAQGYGGHFRRMFATGASHVSGTLTPGDAYGFGSTFYAGRIHRNAFINSIAPAFDGDAPVASYDVPDPTGMSLVYRLDGVPATMVAQGPSWLATRVGLEYSFSFWAYADKAVEILVKQNGTLVGTVMIGESDISRWLRLGVSFNLHHAARVGDGLMLKIEPLFNQGQAQQHGIDDRSVNVLYVTSPQLEAGGTVTQYQPTDDILDYTDDFGAWFTRGGLGGTIQNPLLKLNADGEGSIAARDNSVVIREDGSGHIAQGNIAWDEEGNVTFDGGACSWEDIEGRPDMLDLSMERIPGHTDYKMRILYRQY